jgi:class 3 adenylate cyclase/DNA-binding winged helix-turn-helix (wHTH) protein
MEAVREGRHLAAIMFVDMVGYSARMQQNEPRAIAAVRGLWELVRPILAERGGREVDLAGDGMLMEFPGALAAVRCAMRIQHVLHERNKTLAPEERVRMRAGVHLGDVEHRDGKIYGDGVNIAARVLPLSPPGGIALTPHVRDQLVNVLDQPLERLGSKTLKNIKAPLEIWCITGPDCTAAELAAAKAAAQDEAADRSWRFGNAVFDERTLELAVDGVPVELEKKSLDVLSFLLHHAGEVVTKDEILEAVWPGRVLSESVLTKCISKVREVLRDEDQSTIKTVHGFGYRLAVPVKVEVLGTEPAPHFDFKAGDHPALRPLWSLVDRLGQGGHGEVWLARHDKTKEERVYKFALDPTHLASLKREITLSRVLNDSLAGKDCFVRVLDWNLEQAPYFIECEYSKTGSLVDWAVAQGGLEKIPFETRLEIAAQAAEAVAAAHSVGVLHKDLKPSNILLTRHPHKNEYGVKLCDFGSGGVLDPRRLAEMGITRMGFTKTVLDLDDSTSGTPLYLAPEVLAGQPWTSQADIYALGVVLYQLAVGDFQKTLAPGWEKHVPDEFLREDIAAAAAGTAGQRLADASLLAQRLRTLASRRAQRDADAAAVLKTQKHQQAVQRFRIRFWWSFAVTMTLLVVLIGGFLLWLNTMWTADIAMIELDEIATKMEERGELAEAEIVRRNLMNNYDQWKFNAGLKDGLHFRDHLALLLMKRNKRAETEEQFKILLTETADAFGTEEGHYSVFSSNYGEFLLRQGRLAEARTILETAQPLLKKAQSEAHICVRFMFPRNTERLRKLYRTLGLKAEEAALPPEKVWAQKGWHDDVVPN